MLEVETAAAPRSLTVTWRFNPNQFPDAPGLIARMRAAGSAPSSG
jgi:hypothetical protein